MDLTDAPTTLRDGDVHVWLTRPEDVAPNVLKTYVALMTTGERERWQRYRFEKDRTLHLIARALVRTTLSRYADVPPDAWRFEAGEHGRPSISSPRSGLSFNLAHTAGLVACAVSRETEVGVDVERLSAERVSPELSRRVFSEREVEALDRLPPAEQPDRFFDLWTLKESYIKARGLGLAIPLRSFGFHLSDGHAPVIEIAPELRDDPSTWSFRQSAPTSEHRLAVALRLAHGSVMQVTTRQIVPAAPEAPSRGRVT